MWSTGPRLVLTVVKFHCCWSGLSARAPPQAATVGWPSSAPHEAWYTEPAGGARMRFTRWKESAQSQVQKPCSQMSPELSLIQRLLASVSFTVPDPKEAKEVTSPTRIHLWRRASGVRNAAG